jgi:hypothetical protein
LSILTASLARVSYLVAGFASSLCILAALAFPHSAHAGTSVSSVPTNLSGSAEKMISYRHQERMWQTPDGSLHLVLNRGTPKPGLVLYSSYDRGTTWALKLTFSNTNRESTADGVLQGSILALAYGTADDGIAFAQLSYDSTRREWLVNRSEMAYFASPVQALNPTIAIDDLGVVWCGFAAIDRATEVINLRLIYRPSDGTWANTGLILGPTNNISKERSIRMVRVPGGMGLIYRVRQSTYWATRDNFARYDTLSTPVLINEGPPQRPTSDTYASHFSVIADDSGYLHLVIADDGNAMYLRHTIGHGIWTAARKVNGAAKLSYLQIGMANGQVAVVLSASRGAGAVLLSSDGGESFQEQFNLLLPPETDGVSYKTGRVESAGRSNGQLVVLQQYEDHRQQRLMVYNVPVP